MTALPCLAGSACIMFTRFTLFTWPVLNTKYSWVWLELDVSFEYNGGKVKGSPKWLQFILTGTWMCGPNLFTSCWEMLVKTTNVNLMVVKWWTHWQTATPAQMIASTRFIVFSEALRKLLSLIIYSNLIKLGVILLIALVGKKNLDLV